MKPTANQWTMSFLVLGVMGVFSSAQAAPPSTFGWTAGVLAVGQDRAEESSAARRQSDELLRRARQAIKDGDAAAAEDALRQAEKLDVKYNSNLFSRFAETPEKIRKDLDALKRQQGTAPVKPSTRFQPDATADKAPPSAQAFPRTTSPALEDPAEKIAAGAEANATSGIDRGLRSQFASEPKADPAGAVSDRFPALPAPRGFGKSAGADETPADLNVPQATVANDAGGDQRGQSDALLRDARRALANRDVRQAAQFTAQARQLGVNYPLNEDSPDKVDQLVKKATQLPTPQTPGVAPADVARMQAQFLLEQAEGLLRYRDFDTAERLARQAKQLPAEYKPFERTPDRVLDQVAFQRRLGGGPTANEGLAQGGAEPGMLQRIPATANDATSGGAKQEALRLAAQARAALDRGDLTSAQQSINKARALGVPDSAFQPGEPNPEIIALQVERALVRRENVMPAGGSFPVEQAAANEVRGGGRFAVAPGVYDPSRDGSQVRPAQATEPTPAARPSVGGSEGDRLFDMGLKALEKQDRATALKLFREAWKNSDQMDPAARNDLRDKLSLLQEGPAGGAAPRDAGSALEAVDAKQSLVKQKLQSEILGEQEKARRMLATDPKGALQRLQAMRDRVNEAEIDPAARKQLLTLVDRNLSQFESFVEQNRSEIENNERNREVLESVERDRRLKGETQTKFAELVEEFNSLIDQRRYAEAEVRAKQARELDPDNPVSTQLLQQAKFARRIAQQESIKDAKERGFYEAMTRVDESSTPFDDTNPLVFDKARWDDVNLSRRKMLERQRRKQTPAEMEINNALSKPVEVRFTNRPLKEVLETLGTAANINIHIDAAGLASESVSSDTPVSINLTTPITLKSALSLILGELNLSYVIQHEVLKVTSEQQRDSDVYPKAYDVADLVIPIPNFTPGYHTGLPNAILEAHRAIGYGGPAPVAGNSILTLAANQSPTSTSAQVLAQMGAGGASRNQQSLGAGPGGLGGGSQPDFDSLIELLTTTVAPTTWSEVGGAGSIERFAGNLSIVVSQTQEVHDQIADLLEQLRRLQDLQVTIEVRFITLRDNFFERMGIDFDFRIDDNSGLNLAVPAFPDDIGASYAIGLTNNNGTAAPTADLDIPFEQNSFASTLPQFGGFDANTAANFGFAILSDIEVFFLLQAAEGDQRSNVLQAPKVTLFNGQQASVSDTSQRPFVTSIIPVVGDFAAAHQPVIVVLNEGTSLSVQAVVSADRRFVRLTLVPFFSKIGDVQTFTFAGKTTTRSGTAVKDPTNDNATVKDNEEVTTEGTTVQLPTFSFTTVTTTVSVPDGGTVLLGGIKRLSEARSERGVPMLSKIPYVSRLFKNVGIGRETQSLMLMVTPRIIIQEEEEAKLGIDLGS